MDGSEKQRRWRLLGRAGRMEYWICVAILIIALFLTSVLNASSASTVIGFFWIVLWIRRLHDTGRSGWETLWPIGLSLVCLAGGFLVGRSDFVDALLATQPAGQPRTPSMSGVIDLLAVVSLLAVVQFGYTVWLGFRAGDPNENRYGLPTVASSAAH
jgi:uncharacterized membrane protein YhaH (DUF805 family)